MTVVTRFAPSPTGDLHLGGARTALFNYAFARGRGGRFLLRVEDTDAARNSDASKEGILEAMLWLGLDWDGEVIMQSDRVRRHRAVLETLRSSGAAYPAFETAEDLASLRAAGGKAWVYDGPSKVMSRDEAESRVAKGDPHVWRLRTPSSGEVSVADEIRGVVKFPLATLSDPVIWRSSTDTPLYNFACAIDDLADGVTHVIRGEEHLENAAVQSMVRAAAIRGRPDLIGSAPEVLVWAHLPIVTRNGKKMSKRDSVTETDGPVGVLGRRDAGWNPEPLLNHLALLGWSRPDPKSSEIFGLDEFVDEFGLDRVRRSPSNFDEKKARRVQKVWMSALPGSVLSDRCAGLGLTVTESAADLAKEKSFDLRGLADMVAFLADETPLPEDDVAEIALSRDEVSALADGFAAGAFATWEDVVAQVPGREPREVAFAVRIALTGRRVAPDIMGCAKLLGADVCEERMKRLSEAMQKIADTTPKIA